MSKCPRSFCLWLLPAPTFTPWSSSCCFEATRLKLLFYVTLVTVWNYRCDTLCNLGLSSCRLTKPARPHPRLLKISSDVLGSKGKGRAAKVDTPWL